MLTVGLLGLALSAPFLLPKQESAGPNERAAAAATDLETRLGIWAEQAGRAKPPRSLHARAANSRDHGAPTPAQSSPPDARQPAVKLDPLAGAHPVIRVRPGAHVPVRESPGGAVAVRLADRTEFGSPTVLGVITAAKNGWVGVTAPQLGNRQVGWVRLDRRVALDWVEHSIHISLSKRRATLRLRDRALGSFPVTVGAPGTDTPTGRFAITDAFRGDLNPVYGCCALALSAVQPNLPPGWPGGDRIAIHGNGTGGPLGVAASNGCLRADDQAVSQLVDRVELGAPVFIRQ